MTETTKADEKLLATGDGQSAEADELVAEGIRLGDAGKYDEAIEKYKKALDLQADAWLAHINWGVCLNNLQKHEQAIPHYEECIAHNFKVSDAYRLWGEALAGLGDYKGAREKFDKALEGNRDSAQIHFDLGFSFGNLKQYDDAIAEYKKATELQPDFGLAYINWGVCLSNLKRYLEAIPQFEKCIALNFSVAEAYRLWGEALTGLQDYDGALVKLQKSLEIRPDFAQTYFDIGFALGTLKRYEMAVEQYKKAAELDPAMDLAYVNWGINLANLGKFDEAIKQYKKATDSQPNLAMAWLNWGISLANLGQFEEAIKKYARTMELDSANTPDSDDELRQYLANTYLYWGIALVNLKRYGDAIEKYAQAGRLRVDPQLTNFNWGVALGELRRYDDAIEKYRAATDARPETPYPYGLHNIGFLYWKKGQFSIARQEWGNARAIYEQGRESAAKARNADYFQYFGEMLRAMSTEPLEIQSVLDEGLSFQPDHPGILSAQVAVYLDKWQDNNEITDYWKARQSYKKAEASLKEMIKNRQDANLLLRLGRLHLAVDECDDAEKILKQALKADGEIAEIHADLGLIRLRQNDPQGGLRHLEAALRRDPDNLTIRGNFADACVKAKRLDQAETEYKKVLRLAKNHLESLIGLGECYTAMAELGNDEELFQEAERQFLAAININESSSNDASKQLKKKDLTAIYYSIGYARVKRYEAVKVGGDESLLRDAEKYFKMSYAADNDHERANRAAKAIKDRLRRIRTEWFAKQMGAYFIFGLSLLIFLGSSTSFFWSWPRPLNEGYYALLGFGSVLFMIAGLSLPQLLKLKVGSIELEKGPGDQSIIAGPLGIKRDQAGSLSLPAK
jgi:tetratricopeptide (TPR) repeat protein